MLKFICRAKMTLPPHPPTDPYLLINTPSLSCLKEMLDKTSERSEIVRN